MAHERALDDLAALLGPRLSRSRAERDLHGANEAWFAAAPPDAVAYPLSTAEVAQIATICAARGCPITAWGAGTSLEGHALALSGGISLDMSRMNRVLAIRGQDMQAVVEPGVTREALNTELRATGLMFSVDPGANASIGGMTATRASGTTAVRYGTMRDNVLALQVVLADGRVIRTGSGARKSSAGYDLTGLFVGSEGTLGLITEITLKLHGQPESVMAATCAFDDFAVADAPRYGDARWRPVFEYVRALTLAPASVFRGHTEALLAAGWSEDVIVQLTTITSGFNVLNRLADAFGLSANEEFFALAGQRLAAKGYGGTAEMLGLAVAA